MITCRPCVQTTLPFFWHLGLIKYYNSPVSLCGFTCVSLWYISLWPFCYRKMTTLLTRTKLFKDCLRNKFQLKIHLIFCPSRPLSWELRLGLDCRRPKVLLAADGAVLPSCPHLRTLQRHCHLWLVFCYLKAKQHLNLSLQSWLGSPLDLSLTFLRISLGVQWHS